MTLHRRQIEACQRMLRPVNALLLEMLEANIDRGAMLYVRHALETCIAENQQAIEIAKSPQCVAAEQALIGALLCDYRLWSRVPASLTDSDFVRDDHRRIFRHIKYQADACVAFDIATTWESIAATNETEQVGKLDDLGTMALNAPTAPLIERYAEIIQEAARTRRESA